MLRDLIEKYDLTIVTNEPVCSGKWTRIHTQITKIKNLRLCNLYELFKILYTGNDHWWRRKL